MGEKLRYLSVRSSLSMRLLLLTVFFVMLAEVLIYVPSIANFRTSWLEERLAAANIAILAIEAAPDHMINEALTKQLLDNAKIVAISLKQKDKRRQIINTDQPLNVTARYDIRNASYGSLLWDAITGLIHVHPHESLILVTGNVNFMENDANTFIEIIFYEDLLCEDMYKFSYNVLLLSIIISLITAGLVYFSLSHLLIKPVQNMTRSVMSFRTAPEDATEDLNAEGRQDEIGIIMRELGAMQGEIRRALTQKKHLAQLGEGVSKINHDLRNILSSAQMVSDHLSTVNDPVVKKLTPRFVTAIDRAIRLCENTLKYGKTGVERPKISPLNLNEVVDEVVMSLGISEIEDVKLTNDIPADFIVAADPDQIFRVFLNLSRNALQAVNQNGEITIAARREKKINIIDIIDNGPGIPAQIRTGLFQPFQSGSSGGSGLGLAISKEIMEAHGGSIEPINAGKVLWSGNRESFFESGDFPHQKKRLTSW